MVFNFLQKKTKQLVMHKYGFELYNLLADISFEQYLKYLFNDLLGF